MAGQIFLEDISVFELSPTAEPANRWSKLFQKSTNKESDMPHLKEALEWLEKATISAKCKEAMKKAMANLAEVKDEMPEEQWKCFRKAFSFGDEEKEEEKKAAAQLEELKKSAKTSTAEIDRIKEIVKKSVAHLDAQTPSVKSALDELSALIGHTPVHQILAALPEAARAQIEMLQKSHTDTKKELEELRKSQVEAARAERRRVMLSKAATLPHVPLGTDELADLLLAVTDGNAMAGESLEKMLGAVEAVVSNSELLREIGSSASGSTVGVMAKVETMAQELIQKSLGTNKPIDKPKAISMIFEANPSLYHEWEREHKAALRGQG